jgi:hypothetical protein
MSQEHIDRIEQQITELSKHSIDWRFLTATFIPVGVIVCGSLINMAIQVSTITEKLNALSSNLNSNLAVQGRELEKLANRIDKLEQKINDRK